jgi:multiple sugar transport system substrate-binding protein
VVAGGGEVLGEEGGHDALPSVEVDTPSILGYAGPAHIGRMVRASRAEALVPRVGRRGGLSAAPEELIRVHDPCASARIELRWAGVADRHERGTRMARIQLFPSTLQTATYEGKYYGVPEKTDAGLLYYRKDRTATPPDTWQALYGQAKDAGGFVYQGKAYEGLTVHFLEVAYGAGGKVLSDDGKKSEINSPENVSALELMADGIKSGAVPKAVLTYQEGESQQAFDGGKPGFMRNWPYAYSLEKESKTAAVKRNFDVAPLPEFEGRQAAGVLGGSNLVISRFSKNQEASLKLVDLLTKPDAMRLRATKYSLAPVLTASYDDAAIKEALPFSAALRTAIEQAKARPVSPSYTQISTAISSNVAKALSGRLTPEAALQAADKAIGSALSTF